MRTLTALRTPSCETHVVTGPSGGSAVSGHPSSITISGCVPPVGGSPGCTPPVGGSPCCSPPVEGSPSPIALSAVGSIHSGTVCCSAWPSTLPKLVR
eukprot:6038002-Pyramimonas_sp.AAC.1